LTEQKHKINHTKQHNDARNQSKHLHVILVKVCRKKTELGANSIVMVEEVLPMLGQQD
jgi:hypothetical protein